MYWDKVITKILMNKKEKSSHDLCNKIKKMDQQIVMQVLRVYFQACKQKHAVAFF